MDLRTHVWGASTTGVAIIAVGIGAMVWLRPLPNGAAKAYAQVEATADAHQRGDLSADAATRTLHRLATATAGFGESRSDGSDADDPYEPVREQAIRQLGLIEGPAASAALRELALHNDRLVNLHAVEALRRRRDKDAMATFFAVLAHDDQRQRRLDDHFARVTQETLRAIRDLADGGTLLQLRQFADADRRMFDQDIRRTITLMARDLETPTVPGIPGDTNADLATIDSLLNPNAGRLGNPGSISSDGLVQSTRGTSPIILPAARDEILEQP